MKTKWLLIPMFILSMCSAFGQRLELELALWPTWASLRGNEVIKEHFQPVTTIVPTISAKYYFFDYFGFGVYFLFNVPKMKGDISLIDLGDQASQFDTSNIRTYQRFFYYKLLLPIHYEFGDHVRGYIDLGGFFGYLSKMTQIVEAVDEPTEITMDGTEQFERWNVGICGEIGIMIPLSEKFFLRAGVHDDVGLVDIGNLPYDDDVKMKTNDLYATVGVFYQITFRD